MASNLTYRAFKVDRHGNSQLLGDLLADNHHHAQMLAMSRFKSGPGGLAVINIPREAS